MRKRLSDLLKLHTTPVFDKRAFFNSIPAKERTGPLDGRGGDVALFISNCSPNSWRTNYMDAILPLLTRPPPYGFGLIVDSYGGCHSGFGIDQENGGSGWTFDQVSSPTHDWNTTETLDLSQYPHEYPWKKTDGGHRNSVSKDEMIRHYKVFLNFENALVSGYATEKFYQSVATETVSIVFGPPPHGALMKQQTSMTNFTHWYWPHERSNFVDGWYHSDPRDMAKEIYKLTHDELYWKSFFEWRVPPTEKAYDSFQVPLAQGYVNAHLTDFTREDSQSWMCRMCEWYSVNWDQSYA